MENLDMKQKVLKEIMGLMDEKEGESLKLHPKLQVAKVEIDKPEEEGLLGESAEAPEMEAKEGDEELSPEMIQKVLEMYKDLK